MKNELNPFDRRIKDKLENHEVPFEESHWDQMEEKLQQDLDPAVGDALLMSRLADWEVPFEEDNWALMEERLDYEDALDAEFDHAAAERMKQMEAPYESGNWEIMTQKIDEAFSIRHWLHRYHVPEMALMVLFCFTLVQYLNWGLLPQRFVKSPAPQVTTHEVIDQTSAGSSDLTVESLSPLIPHDERAVSAGTGSVAEAFSNAQARRAASTVVQPLKQSVSSAAIPPIDRTEADMGIQFFEQPLLSLAAVHKAAEFSSSPNLEPFARGSALAGISAFRQFLKKPAHLYTGAYVGFDYNLVNAPMDEVFDTQGYWTDSIGYRIGLLFATEKKKWGFQTGLTYAEVAYKPIVPVQQYGTFDYLVVESFKEIQFQFLQIPLQVRRGFLLERSKWDVYAIAGAEANLIFDANYDIEREEIFSSRSSGAAKDVADKSRLNEKRFPEGILNGDRFFNNAYLSFSVGMGVERTLSHRYKFFAEPIYTRPFVGDEIGPNDDRIHQFSLRTGLKVRFK